VKWPPLYPRILHRLVVPPALPPLRQVEALLHNQILDLFGVIPLVLQDVEGLLNLLHIPIQDPVRHLLEVNKVLVKVFDELAKDRVELLTVPSLESLILPLLALLPEPSVVQALSAHRAPVVATLQGPLFDAPTADGVAADELEAGALFVAHRALHSLTCFEV